MISITQDLKFKQTVVEYSFKHGVTAAAVACRFLSYSTVFLYSRI